MPKRFLIGALCLFPGFMFAQRLTGYQLSNYAGTNGLYLNPSSIADSRWGTHINLATVSFQASPQPRLPVATVPFVQADLHLRGQNLAMKQADVRGPGAMFQLPDNQAVAVTTRYRSDVNLTGGYDLIYWFLGDKRSLPDMNRTTELTSEAFGELALSYAIPVLNREQHFVKLGGTYKYLRGLQTTSLTANGRFAAPAGQLNYAIDGVQTTYSDLLTLSRLTVADALVGKVPGTGSGFDIGFTYEFRPQAESFQYPMDGKTLYDAALTKYRFRVGVSLLDIGSIRYKNASTWMVQPREGTILQTDVQPPRTPTQVRDAVARSLGIVPEGSVGDLTVKLPQTLSLQLDAQLSEGWFAGLAWWKPANASATAQHRAELISFGPRYESVGREFSVMGNYWQPLGKFSIGTHVRVGIFSFGSDNLFGFFSDNGLAAHVFAGVTLPLKARRPADYDGDAVSDQRDMCPDIAGVWTFNGCPDTDRDGIQDKDDTCPKDAGPAKTKGCPDADSDGILDRNDVCPNEPGLAKFSGCPDTDDDGIANSDDGCPTEAGLPGFGGCPDADSDGLSDSRDTCPTEAGLQVLDGCALKAVARTDSVLSAPEKKLLDELNRSWLPGPTSDPAALDMLQSYLTTHPKRLLTLEFSGASQEQLVRVITLFNDELGAYFGGTERFRFTSSVRAGEPAAGLKVGLVNEK